MKNNYSIKKASGLISWFLYEYDYGGITMPWKTIYIREDRLDQERLIKHELVHVDQIERFGAIKFVILYFYYQLRYGYKNNPFEIEAREKSGW